MPPNHWATGSAEHGTLETACGLGIEVSSGGYRCLSAWKAIRRKDFRSSAKDNPYG